MFINSVIIVISKKRIVKITIIIKINKKKINGTITSNLEIE
jgi:hypothetical protein